MATLTEMKTRILSDLDNRADVNTDISSAISETIRHYQRNRFYFNVRRSLTFTTVAGTANYGTSTAAGIATFYKIDMATITISGQRFELERTDLECLELYYDSSVLNGQPTDFAYFNREVWLYPVPTDAYTVRLIGHQKVDEPSSDSDVDNDWVNEAYDLIYYGAKARLALNKLQDQNLFQAAAQAEQLMLRQLRKETVLREGPVIIEGSFA